jgi:hypothetical protein
VKIPKGKILHKVNNVLASTGVELRPLTRDFDDHFTEHHNEKLMLARVARTAERFLREDCIFPAHNRFAVDEAVRSFFASYRASPFRVTFGGSHFTNLLWLYLLRLSLAADLVIDSGTFMGGSAWALSQGPDKKRVSSFDIDLGLLRTRTPGVEYNAFDWTRKELPDVDPERSLCFFDDHVDQVRRVQEAHGRHFRYLVFDDDVEVTAVPSRVKEPSALPKLSFLEDPDLADGLEIAWFTRGRRNRFVVDRGHLEAARALILRMQRVPDLSAITGIHQLPLRLVVLRSEPV